MWVSERINDATQGTFNISSAPCIYVCPFFVCKNRWKTPMPRPRVVLNYEFPSVVIMLAAMEQAGVKLSAPGSKRVPTSTKNTMSLGLFSERSAPTHRLSDADAQHQIKAYFLHSLDRFVFSLPDGNQISTRWSPCPTHRGRSCPLRLVTTTTSSRATIWLTRCFFRPCWEESSRTTRSKRWAEGA